LLRLDDTASYNLNRAASTRRSGVVAFFVPDHRIARPARKAALGLNVRKIPTRFIDISGMGRRCSSYFHRFYNSTQFARDQERAASCVDSAHGRANVSEALSFVLGPGRTQACAPVDTFD
jgi:hypothetical protein